MTTLESAFVLLLTASYVSFLMHSVLKASDISLREILVTYWKPILSVIGGTTFLWILLTTDFSDPTGKSYNYGANYKVDFRDNGRAILTQSKEGQWTPYCRTEGYWRRDDEKFIYLSGFSNGNCPWVQRDVDSHKFVIDGGRLVKR